MRHAAVGFFGTVILPRNNLLFPPNLTITSLRKLWNLLILSIFHEVELSEDFFYWNYLLVLFLYFFRVFFYQFRLNIIIFGPSVIIFPIFNFSLFPLFPPFLSVILKTYLNGPEIIPPDNTIIVILTTYFWDKLDFVLDVLPR